MTQPLFRQGHFEDQYNIRLAQDDRLLKILQARLPHREIRATDEPIFEIDGEARRVVSWKAPTTLSGAMNPDKGISAMVERIAEMINAEAPGTTYVYAIGATRLDDGTTHGKWQYTIRMVTV